MSKRPKMMDLETAETIAMRGLRFLAADPDRLGRFLSTSGIGPQDLRGRAGDHEVLNAVIEFLMSDESLLLVFCADEKIDPRHVGQSGHVLSRQSQ